MGLKSIFVTNKLNVTHGNHFLILKNDFLVKLKNATHTIAYTL